MELLGSVFTLREWQSGDEQSLQEQANNKNISCYLLDRFPYPYTMDDAKKYVSSHQNQNPLTNFAIIINYNVAGGIEFKPGKDIYRKNALLGYWLGQTFWSLGIMTEAVKLITSYAFENFDIIRMQANVNANNPASMRVLEKAGFQKEGVLKRAIVKYGEVIDEHLYALVK
jgi:ribosomal-protein-alanine N-acetyltransferase